MSEIEDTQDVSHCSRCDFEQLQALYQLNVEAKRYSKSAEDAYVTGLKSTARLYSLRKRALYGLKQAILGELVEEGCVDTVDCHEIDDRLYYCLYVCDFSFHSPIDEWDEPSLDAPTSPSKSLESFDADPDNRTDYYSEEEALKRLTEQFETPNNYLPVLFVDRGYRSEFAGWSQLPGAVEEDGRIVGRFDREINTT